MRRQNSYLSSNWKKKWVRINAEGQTLGRLASRVANVLRGKEKVIYEPSRDNGDYVIVLNVEKIIVTGNKRKTKSYISYSGYPGGLKTVSFKDMVARRPEEVLRSSVRRMLPKNRLGRKLINNLKVYKGNDHPHEAQEPTELIVRKKELKS